MSDIKQLKNFIDPHKETNKDFFLDLLDNDKQQIYENEHVFSVMTLLKVLYLNKHKLKIDQAKKERDELNKGNVSAENLRRIIELNAEIKNNIDAINSYKPFFDEPYFARMDLEDNIEGYNSYYIGKRGFESLEIVDWRAPLAKKYYQKSQTNFSINEYNYKLILRRALRTKSGKVLDMKNEYLALADYLTSEEIGGRDESVIFDPFLKEILTSRKEKREITDIIETIQEKQYEIITLPEKGEFILQGVAGSGKTMILLHRLSYILYNNENLKPTDMLVITPSDSFNAFIDELAEILELEKVKTLTLDNYFLNLLKHAGVDVASKVDFNQTLPYEFLEYIYSERFAQDLRKRLYKIFDSVHGLFTADESKQAVENIVNSLDECVTEYTKIKNASLRVRRSVLGEIKEKKEGGIYFTKQFRNLFNCVGDVKEFLEMLKESRMSEGAFFYKQVLTFYKSIKFIRKYSEKICLFAIADLKDLSKEIEKEIIDLGRYKTISSDRETLTYFDRIEKRKEIEKEVLSTIEQIDKIRLAFASTHEFCDIINADSYFSAIGRCENTYEVLRFFYRETVKKYKAKYGVSTKKLCKADPFALCFILKELGFPLSPKYSFLFVDEAQDISKYEYEILRTVNDRGAFNIFGDLKQNITLYRGLDSWDKFNLKVYNLNLNYRNTNRIVEHVAKNLNIDMQAIGFEGNKVESISARNVTSYLASKKGLTAIITSENNYENFNKKSYNKVRETGRISKTKINLMTVYESKGLEFTAVAVADYDLTDNEKYIAYTRALKDLALIRQ